MVWRGLLCGVARFGVVWLNGDVTGQDIWLTAAFGEYQTC